jgi:hypothetical protein
MIPGRNFNLLYKALMEPVRALEAKFADAQRQAARAEVTGALEVVSSLPSAGEKGRMLYLSTDDQIYFDNGTSWVPMGGGVGISTYSVELSTGTTTSSASFVNVTGSDISHSFSKDNALVAAVVLAQGGTGSRAEVVPQVDGTDGTTIGGVKFTNAQSTWIASIFSGLLSASDPATVRLRVRSSGGANVSVNPAVLIMYVIVEF